MFPEVTFTSKPTKKQLIAFIAYLPLHIFVLPQICNLLIERGIINPVMGNVSCYALGMAYMLVIGRNFWWNEYNALCDNWILCIRTVIGSYLLMMAGNYGVNEIIIAADRLIDGNAAVNYAALAAGVYMFCVPFLYDFYRKHTRARSFWHTVLDILCITAIVFSVMLIVADIFADLANPAMDNPNNSAILDAATQNSGAMAAMAIFMAPIVEEPLFRAGFFAPVRHRSRFAAYAVTILLFAGYHIFGYAAYDPRQWIYLLQYIPVTFLLCRAYERTNSIWTAVFFHMLVNSVSMMALGAM